MGTTIKQRLMDFLAHAGISQSKFERSIGVSNGFVRNLGKEIGSSKMARIIAEYPSLNIVWLATGKGQMLNENYPNSAISGEQNEKNAEKSNTIQQGRSREQAEEKPTTDKEIIMNLLQTVHDKDVIIAKQAEEICQLREKIARLEAELMHTGYAATDVQKRPAASE